ncbi:l-galactose dehydrogenase [Trichonephila clavata]|uniref:L-galactose dehydrogenase n=1 Tax=Trichonephila clavata TaxID=2740835 RepID=A0A8X6KC97_TRICU|nr:l-galactose dehydrogenase [Trichonephila clavata]
MSSNKSYKQLPTYQEGFHNDSLCKSMVYSSFGKTGLEVSLLGLGTSELALVYNTPEEENGIQTVVNAIKSGINYIDTAPYYGQGKAEIVLGKALKRIPRNTYYLATKVARYGAEPQNMFDFSGSLALKSFDESLQKLGVDYIDIIQVHDVEFAKDANVVVNETLPALQKLKDMGKVKFIGITGYSLIRLKEVLQMTTVHVDIVLSYCRCTLFDNSLKDYIPFFKEKNVAIINAAILGMGLLTHNGPPDWHPVGPEIKEACRLAAEYCKEQNVNISKLAACYAFSQPDIHTHLIGMQNEKLLEANLISINEGLSLHEEKVKQEIIEKYFKNLTKTHWENIEVNIYWETLKKLNLA